MRLHPFLYLVFISIFFVACGSKKQVVATATKSSKKISAEASQNSFQQQHIKKLKESNVNLNSYTLIYIETYAPLAVKKMHEYKIPASITLAQGVLESGNGRSELARKSNNHFGIKCHRGWQGKKTYHDDDERNECFRKYKYVEQSYNDHSKFLVERKRYANLFTYKTTDYKSWARGLKKAGYATDKKYPTKLIKIIEDYELYRFDRIKEKDMASKKNNTKVIVQQSVSIEKIEKVPEATIDSAKISSIDITDENTYLLKYVKDKELIEKLNQAQNKKEGVVLVKKDSLLEAKKALNLLLKDTTEIDSVQKKNQEQTNKYYHQVQKGETLYSIAKQYHLTVNQLKLLNNLEGNELQIGQKLLIK